ncbi:MAG TPA: anti-sigma factor [Symbiobacteriaceae bacterium]|nr:anti-sigma factor [Symbiobacteriaceae bacterium]
MTSEHPELDILAYLTDELDAAEATEVRDHLAGCPACAAEAADLRSISQHLSTRLKEIPPTLAVPPLVSARIERALQAERRQTKRRPFWPGLSVAVAAAAVVLVSFGVRPDLAESVAEIPIVGLVATPFLQPDYEVQLATMPPSTAASVGVAQRTEPNIAVTANGVKVVVTRLEQKANQTTLSYRAEGATLISGLRNLGDFAPMIEGNGHPATLYRLTADQRGSDVLFVVTFEAVPHVSGLELKALPLEGLPAQQKPWSIPLQ